jgi:hypothetical protein
LHPQDGHSEHKFISISRISRALAEISDSSMTSLCFAMPIFVFPTVISALEEIAVGEALSL